MSESSVTNGSIGRGRGGPRHYVNEHPGGVPPPAGRGRGRSRGGFRDYENSRDNIEQIQPSNVRNMQDNNRYNKRARESDKNEKDNKKSGKSGIAREKKHRETASSTKPDRDQIERDRKERMNRLRAEIEEEERDIALKETEQSTASNTPSMAKDSIRTVDASELEGLEEEDQMELILGFSSGFGSTKGKVVEDNLKTAARGAAGKNKARKYRQYMNRKGGFNRPLEKMT